MVLIPIWEGLERFLIENCMGVRIFDSVYGADIDDDGWLPTLGLHGRVTSDHTRLFHSWLHQSSSNKPDLERTELNASGAPISFHFQMRKMNGCT